MSASDRFQLVAHPAIEPGTDLITGSTVGPFVDCGAWVPPSPRKRRVYLSVETVRQLAEAAGVVNSNSGSEERDRQQRALGALDFMRENLGGDMADVIRRLARLLDDGGVAAVDPHAHEHAAGDGAAAGQAG